MSNTDDKRTPDGTEALPVDADPTSDWAPQSTQRTPDQPTEQLGAPKYTADPTEAYGGGAAEAYGGGAAEAYGGGATQAMPAHPDQPTQAYPTYEAYQGGQQPNPTQAYPTYDAYQGGQQPNPTQAYPTYDAYQGGQQPNPTQAYPTYEAYQAGQQPNATQTYPTAYAGQQTGYPPPGDPNQPYQQEQPDGGKKGPGKGVLIAAGTVAGLLLVAVIGVGAMLLSGGGDDSTASAPTSARALPPTATVAPSTPPSGGTQIEPPDLSRIPGGVGEAIGAAGAAIGSVRSNDGSTLILDGIGGSSVTVTTDASTQVIAIGASTVDELKVGETVLVQGDSGPNGTVAARVIISTHIPDLGGLGGN